MSRNSELQHADSLAFLKQARLAAEEIFCPSLVLPECAGAIARTTKDPDLSKRIVHLIITTPNLRVLGLSIPLAEQAAELTAEHQLRGTDACYVALAREQDSTLVTWDMEMLERGSAVVDTCTPKQWLERNAQPLA